MRTEIIKCSGLVPLSTVLKKPCRFVSLWRSNGNTDGKLWSDTGYRNDKGEFFWEGQLEDADPSDFDWLLENGDFTLLVDWDE